MGLPPKNDRHIAQVKDRWFPRPRLALRRRASGAAPLAGELAASASVAWGLREAWEPLGWIAAGGLGWLILLGLGGSGAGGEK